LELKRLGLNLLGLLALCGMTQPAHAGFFLWLDSPSGRSNPFDPKNPNFRATAAPLATPTPVPLPGLTMRLKDSGGNAKAGFLVMLGNSTTNTATTDATGRVNFPTAVFPADLHVISPWSQSLTAGCVTSYIGITFSPIDLYLAAQTYSSAMINEQITRTAGTNFFMDRYAGGGGYGGSGGSGGSYSCSPPVPMQYYTSGFSGNVANTVNFSAIEFDCAWTPVAAIFVPQQILPTSGLTISAQTALSGFNTAFTNAMPSNTIPWSYIGFDGLCGSSPSDRYAVIGQDLGAAASVTLPWTYLSGFSYFEMTAHGDHDYGGGEYAYAQIALRSASPAPSWNPAFPALPRVLQTPSQAAPGFIFDRDPAMSPSFGVASIVGSSSQFQWNLVIQCGACPATYGFNLPALPAAAPIQYAFQSGETVHMIFWFYTTVSETAWAILQNQSAAFYYPAYVSSSRSGIW
jgi:hypothetical protein